MSLPATSCTALRRLSSVVLLLLLLTVAASQQAAAQLSGTFTVGSGGTYATIDAAVAAIAATGSITGPVNMLIRAGTYTPPSSGWTLPAKAGMSSTNRITFRPYPGESVVLSGSINSFTGIFNITGSFYTIDGSNTVGGTTKNLRITQTNASGGFAIRIFDNADENHVRNVNMQSAATANVGSNGGTMGVMGYVNGGPDNTIIEDNTIGDSTRTYVSHTNVYVYSPYGYRANNTIIRRNVIVNAGHTPGGFVYSYQVRIEYAAGTRVENNHIHYTSGGSNYYMQTVYVYDYGGSSPNTTINANHIRLPYATGLSYEYPWGIYIYSYFSSFTTHNITNNFIFSTSSTQSTYGQGYIYILGGYNTSSTVNVMNNSMYSAGSTYEQALILNYSHQGSTPITVNYRNNIVLSTRTQGYLAMYYCFDYSGTGMGLNTSDNILKHTITGYYWAYPGTQYSSLAAWQGSGQDARTTAVTPDFVNATNYDLHIDSTKVQQLEGRGFQSGVVTNDIDGNVRTPAPYLPDIGADEGNFIGTGLRVTAPTTGLQVTSNYLMTVSFNTTRPMNNRIELTTDNGLTWSVVGTVAPTAPPSSTIIIPTPNIETNQARIRVVSNLNPLERDSSGLFSLVRPVFTILQPNGGEALVPTDTATIRWSSQFVPPTMPVTLEYQLDVNSPWIPIVPSMASQNLPSVNSVSWIVPNTPSSNVRMRVKPLGVTTLGDSSNSVFTIAPMPVLTLMSPVLDDAWYVGETRRIEWNSVTIAQVRVEYSTDAGASWKLATTGTTFVPATQGGYNWIIPDEATSDALVRITSIERPRFNSTGRLFDIIKGEIAIDAPNGGEQFELGQQINVAFRAPTSTLLDLMYSSDGGSTWHNINPQPGVAIAAAAFGNVNVTLPSLPTRRAKLRIVDVDRTWLFDETDDVFEIMEAPGLMIYSPAQGDQLTRGTPTSIGWIANRIGKVHIEYSATGGVPVSSYQRVASFVEASVATQAWTVPNATTANGRIRFLNANTGAEIAESGIFSIVDEAIAALRVEGPNGGEVYNAGDKITVRWSGTNVPTISVRYSSDGGVSWRPIAVNIPAILRQVDWTAPNVGSARYRVAVESINPSISDLSDADFEIKPSVLPSLGLITPAGGETLYAGDTIPIEWAMNGLAGAVTLNYTVDDGTTWKPLVTLPSDALTYSWIVPNEPTLAKGSETGLMSAPTARVMVSQGTLSDTSGGFSIAVRQAPAVAVTAPNGNEIWREGTQVTIGWNFQVLQNVDIMLSTDDGATWPTTIATNIPAAPLNYTWTVPHLSDSSLRTVKVMVRANPGGTPSDVSDAAFTFHPLGTVGIGEITSVHELTLFGAFPNPFTTNTEVRWKQNVSAPVTLRVYNVVGAIVAQQSTDMLTPGDHRMVLSAGTMPSGVYVYELLIGTKTVRSNVTLSR